MSESNSSRRAIPIDSDGVARLIQEFHSHLAVLPPIDARPEPRKPLEWEEEALEDIRQSVRNPETGVVDIDSHVRALALYTEIPFDLIRNISILSLGRIAQKLLMAKGSMAFRHGTYLRIETNPEKASEVFGGELPSDRVVVNVWTPGADTTAPPARRVPVPLLGGTVK